MFNRFISIIMILVFVLFASCINDSSVDPANSGYTVSGRVVNTDGEGVAGVTIVLSGANKKYEIMTSENGVFTLKSVEEGVYVLTSTLDGYVFSLPSNEISVQGITNIPNIIARKTYFEPFPSNNASEVEVDEVLRWVVANMPEGEITFDVKFGTSSDSLYIIVTDLTKKYYDLEKLNISTTYYWQIVMHNAGSSYESPVWQFTTQGISFYPEPNDGDRGFPVLGLLIWSVQNSPGSETTYDVKMGETEDSLTIIVICSRETGRFANRVNSCILNARRARHAEAIYGRADHQDPEGAGDRFDGEGIDPEAWHL